jgi:predicted small lipoprotein YifL
MYVVQNAAVAASAACGLAMLWADEARAALRSALLAAFIAGAGQQGPLALIRV